MDRIFIPVCLMLLAGITVSGSENCRDDFSGHPWGSWAAQGMVASGSLDKTTGRTAPGALKIAIGPECPRNCSMCFLKRLPVTPGKNYTAIVWYRTSGTDPDVRVSLKFQGLDAKGQFLNNGSYGTNKSDSDEWNRLVYSMRIPAGGSKWDQVKFLLCTLGVSNSAGGEVWFDDFEFQLEEEFEDD